MLPVGQTVWAGTIVLLVLTTLVPSFGQFAVGAEQVNVLGSNLLPVGQTVWAGSIWCCASIVNNVESTKSGTTVLATFFTPASKVGHDVPGPVAVQVNVEPL